MWAFSVVVGEVLTKDCFEVATPEHEHPVEALRAYGSEKAFCVRVARGARTGALMTSVPSDLKTSSKLAVNFVSRSRTRNLIGRGASAKSPAKLRAAWVTKVLSGCSVTPRRCARRVACSIAKSTYRRLKNTVSTLKKSVARMPAAWALRNSAQVGPRRGAGPKPWRRSTRRTDAAPTRMPSLRSSPWMRTQPQLRFSRPRRTISSTSSAPIGGRPGPRRRRHARHFRRPASRCQRTSVAGVTGKPRHRSRGRSRLKAASSARSAARYLARP